MIENEYTGLARTSISHRGRKFVYMKPYSFKVWEDPRKYADVQARIKTMIAALTDKYKMYNDGVAFDDGESDEEKYQAVADAIDMHQNLVKYGTIDVPKESQSVYERAVARYVQNVEDTGSPVSENTLEFFQQMARCVLDDAEALMAKCEVITDEKITELCHEVWLNFNED